MITVKIGDTIFTCDTPAQAVQIHQMAATATHKPVNTDGHSAYALSVTNAAPARKNPTQDAIDPYGISPFTFVEQLKKLDGQRLDSTKMKDLVGVNSEHGVGPRLAAWSRVLENHSPPILLSNYITPQKMNNGKMIWFVNSSSVR